MTADAGIAGSRVLVTGAGGQLGQALVRTLAQAGAVVAGSGARIGNGVSLVADITDPAAVEYAIAQTEPDLVIHAAAWTDVDGCERDPERAHRVNHLGSAIVADACQRAGISLVAVGTDFVFAGDRGAPYEETAVPCPVSVYGASKLAGERAVLDADPSFAVARTAWVFGGPRKHFPRTVLQVLERAGSMTVVADEVGNPTYALDLAMALIALASAHGTGIFHLTNLGETSRYGFAQHVAAAAGLDPELVLPTTREEFQRQMPLPADRPADSRLVNRRGAALGVHLRPWQDAVAEYVPLLADEIWPERLKEKGLLAPCASS